jgi:hypothetical protein
MLNKNIMEIKKLLKEGQEIWGKQNLTLSQIIVRMGKVFGDICRWERNSQRQIDMYDERELKKELGHMIFCNILWCDELGFDPEECIQEAIKSQRKFEK